jgi:uncharacterized protein with GYD domain
MPAYLTLGNWTDQGIRNAKGTVDRTRAAKQAAESLGGRFIGIWWTLRQYDLISITEFPDDETYTRFALSIAMQGNLRTTLRAFSEEEAERIVQGLP